MNLDPITIKQFLAAYYEDLDGELLIAEEVGEATRVVFECDDWRDVPYSDGRRRFEFVFNDVVESTLVTPYRWVFGINSTRGTLVEQHHSSEWTEVYWKSAPANGFEVLGRLYANHEILADRQRDLRDYLVASIKTLQSSSGLLLHGPTEYAASQLRQIEDIIEVYSTPSHRPQKTLTGIGFDDAYVLCKEIQLHEIPRPKTC